MQELNIPKPKKKKALQDRRLKAALSIAKTWQFYIDEGKKAFPNDTSKQSWYEVGRKQAYKDSLDFMKMVKLIDDFNVCPPIVKLDEQWYQLSNQNHVEYYTGK